MSGVKKKKRNDAVDGTFEEEPAPESEPKNTLARRESDALGRKVESRADLVKALDEELKNPGGTAKIVEAIRKATLALSPIFSVTSVPGLGGEEATGPLSSDITIEILCSAAIWLAHAKNVSKTELLEKFEAWMKDNGYE